MRSESPLTGPSPPWPWQRAIRILGLLVATLALVYVGRRIASSWTDLASWRPSPSLLVVLALGAVSYGAADYLLSTAWHLVLTVFGDAPDRVSSSHRLYAQSQIAKYLPGNVAHLAGRHVLGRRAGSTHRSLTAAALLEICGLLFAAGLLSGVAVATGPVSVPYLSGPAPVIVTAIALLLPFGGIVAIRRLTSIEVPRSGRLASGLLTPLSLHLLFFSIGGLVLLVVVSRLGALSDGAPWLVVAVFALSWMAGFLTPGAPAGLGVREAAVIAALTPFVTGSGAVVAALSLRLVTVVGDALYFGSSFLLPTGDDERS